MKQNKLELGQFIQWEMGQNYPFSACMSKLMECLGGDSALYSYDFFAGISGDDFVFAYGNNGRLNDCVSVCEETETFLRRTLGRIGLDYTLLPSTGDANALLEKIRDFIDRGIPVLVKGEEGTYEHSNYDLIFAYDGDTLTKTNGDPQQYTYTFPIGEARDSYIFIDTLPQRHDLAAIYRESLLQLPSLLTARNAHGVLFGAAGLRKWADDIETGRYDGLAEADFDFWRDWSVYVCNIATNARHSWDFLAKAYLHNPDLPGILRLLALLDRNQRDCWMPLEEMGFGLGIQMQCFADAEKKQRAAQLIRDLAAWHEEMAKLF